MRRSPHHSTPQPLPLLCCSAELQAVDVRIGPGKEDYCHTLQGGAANTASPCLVYVPGYGAGSAFMFRTFAGLAAGFRLFAVDLLGTGLSGRPPFRARTTAEAEEFFVSSLAKWREAQGGAADKMVLVGHSIGGYLSAVYALKHPEHVQHLVLVCPAGVGRKPDDWQFPESLRSPWTIRGQLRRMAALTWDWGMTPGTLIRSAGPWGVDLVEGYTRRHLKQEHHLSDEEADRLAAYMYQVRCVARRGAIAYNLPAPLVPSRIL